MHENKKMAIVRLVVLAITLVNSVLAHYGYSPIPTSEEFIYQTISDVILIGSAAWAAYKNNDVTDAGVKGTAVARKLKGKSMSRDEHESFVEVKKEIEQDNAYPAGK